MNDLFIAIQKKLSTVLDPETGIDVVRMGLIESLEVSAEGVASYQIRPSSMFCPLAVPLSISIINAVKEVKNVTGQNVEVVGYAKQVELNQMLADYIQGAYASD